MNARRPAPKRRCIRIDQSRTRADPGTLLSVLREIGGYRKDKRLAARFYGEMLPVFRGTESLTRYSSTLRKTGVFR